MTKKNNKITNTEISLVLEDIAYFINGIQNRILNDKNVSLEEIYLLKYIKNRIEEKEDENDD